MRSYSAGDKLPESTGDKLLESTGEIDSTLLAKLLTTLGKWLHWDVWYSAGEQSYIKTAGDACWGISVHSAGEYWDLLGIPNFLRDDSSLTLLGESIADSLEILCLARGCWETNSARRRVLLNPVLLSGSEGILVASFSWTYLSTLVDRATRPLRQLIIAPVSDVTYN